MAHQPIEDLELFRLYEEVADWSWHNVKKWTHFDRETVGDQLVTSIDSINANLVEGDGRYGTADAIRFFVIARASAREGRLWIRRAKTRELVNSEEAELMLDRLTQATRWLNLLIAYRRQVTKGVRETITEYRTNRAELPDILPADCGDDPFLAD